MDHEEMRKAMLRALNVTKTDFTEFCNVCKADYSPQTGENTQLVVSDTIYTLWYCDDCMSDQNEYV
jgi:hypothetical protein